MKKLFILIALIAACRQAYSQAPSDAYIQGIMNAGKIPGAEAVIIKNGYWLYDRSWGKADILHSKNVDRNTIFMMASISKTFIATALMQLWQRGAFQLDDNINNYLPFHVQSPNHPTDTITFRMLVSHTSAIKDNYAVINGNYVHGDSPITLDTFLRNYFVSGGTYYNSYQNFYGYHTGKGYNYSNIGATLAAYLVQRISGDDYAHYCDTAIFAKLCMDNTSLKLAGLADTTRVARPYSWTGSGYNDNGLYGYPDYPDGQLRTNITALARYMTMYMHHGIYNGTRVLDSTTVDEIMTNQFPGITGFPGSNGQGIFFYRSVATNKDTLWGHTGGDAGVSTIMWFNYATNTGVIVLTNADGDITNNMQTIADTLYKYALTATPNATDTFPACNYPTAINPVAINNNFEADVYPNPANDVINISLPAGYNEMGVALYDMVGNIVYSGTIHRNEKIATSQLPSGMYMLTISLNYHTAKYKKIVVNH